jgi:hypothetical protein
MNVFKSFSDWLGFSEYRRLEEIAAGSARVVADAVAYKAKTLALKDEAAKEAARVLTLAAEEAAREVMTKKPKPPVKKKK